jgi:hypothetical protein
MLVLHVRFSPSLLFPFPLFALTRFDSTEVVLTKRRNEFCDGLKTDRSDVIQVTYPGIANLVESPKGDLNDRLKGYVCLKTVDAVGIDRV